VDKITVVKIDLDTIPVDRYRIDAYQGGFISIKGEHYTSSLIISPDKLVPDWPPSAFTDLASQHIEQIIQLNPEIIILGTGEHLYFPAPELIARIFECEIGFEVMDTGAACRCYNLLVSEKRNVAAGLIMIQP
jgi:uncharacterized protein